MKLETLPVAPAHPTVRRARWPKPVIGVLVLALAGAAGWVYVQKSKPAAAATPAGADKGPPKVEVYELAKADLAAIEARVLSVNLPLSGR
jgi:hypothetical protein